MNPSGSSLRDWLLPRDRPFSPRLTRCLPGSSRHFGPPRKWATLAAHAAAHPDIPLREAAPARPKPALQIDNHGWVNGDWSHNVRSHCPPVHVATLAGARLLGAAGHVVTRDDTLLVDTGLHGASIPREIARHPLYLRRRPRPVRPLPGRTLSLATDFGLGSYGHWLHDGLARAAFIARAGFRLEEFDRLFLPGPRSDATRWLLERLPFSPDRILSFDQTHDYEAETLVVTSFPGRPGDIAPEISAFLRELAAPLRQHRPPSRRVYLTRKGLSRHPVNSDEIDAVFRELDFEIINPAQGIDAIAACANAAVVAGVDGSNLANAAFAPAGAALVAIFPSDCPPLPYNLTLAGGGGVTLHLVQGSPLAGQPRTYHANFHLNPDDLRSCLRAAIRAAHAGF